jgi:hypothetical protein
VQQYGHLVRLYAINGCDEKTKRLDLNAAIAGFVTDGGSGQRVCDKSGERRITVQALVNIPA